MRLAELNDQAALRAAPLPGAAASYALRRSSLDRFGQLGLPGRALETWHYTELGGLGETDFDFLAPAPDAAVVAAARSALAGHALDPQSPRLVFIDGHLADDLSSIPQATAALGIEFSSVSATGPLAADSADAALVALNTALVRDRTLIRATGRIEQPLEIICVAGRSGLAAQVRLRFDLAAGARLTAVQRFVDLGTPGSGWLNQVIDAELGAGSELSLYRIQQFGAERTLTSLLRAELADRAQFRAAAVELGAGLSRNELQIALSGEAAVAEFRGLALTRARQHCDTRVDVDHRAPRTRSRQDYRAIAADRSRSVFNGKVTVREGAQHIDARQRNDNLLLTATAEIDTKPELEIYADQVVCSHGATVGELSEQHLFYLQSRGIAADAARAILTTAFADVILRDFGHDGVREQARAAVAAVLPHCLGRE